MSTLGALSQAWTSAEASLPLGWEISGLMRDQSIPGWIAAARPVESGEGVIATGQFHYQALNNLAIKLRELRGATTG